jgi:hypothetical protein
MVSMSSITRVLSFPVPTTDTGWNDTTAALAAVGLEPDQIYQDLQAIRMFSGHKAHKDSRGQQAFYVVVLSNRRVTASRRDHAANRLDSHHDFIKTPELWSLAV